MKISFIGTGLMGYPMAKNLLKKKLDLKIFSRTLVKSKPLEEFGGKITNSLGKVVVNSDIIFTMVPKSFDLRNFTLSPIFKLLIIRNKLSVILIDYY